MTNYECPYCGVEATYFRDNVETEDWTIIEKHQSSDDDEVACKGCTEISEVTSEFECRNCENTVAFHCVYAQPCDDDGWEEKCTFSRTGEDVREGLQAAA